MAFGWLTKETKSAYIARPAESVHSLVYLHPDKSIPRGAKLTVRSDECALFFRDGKYVGRIDAGSVLLDTANIPFLGHLLIDQFTDANHFICEVFFVSLNEIIFRIDPVSLGQYKDMNSANVVSITGGVSYTVKALDPARLVIDLGGQNSDSSAKVEQILNGRMINQMRKAVGMRTQASPVLEVVSNVESEAVSQEIQALGHAEFSRTGIGIGRVFDLALQLDGESLNALREFGKQESGLALQAKGMRLATGDGFAEFNLIQGQRAALEGLGKGLGTGNAPMVMSGFNIGANLTGPAARSASRPPIQVREGTVLSTRSMYVLRGATGETGPFTPRQIALMAISKGLPLSEMEIRGTEDPNDVLFSADLEPQILAEFKRRAPPVASHPVASATPVAPPEATTPQQAAGAATGPNAQAFSMAFFGSVKNGQLTLQEIETLSGLATTLGLDPDLAAARARVSALIQMNDIRIVA
jgi:membrane protease subunit (stomatin/prohibitin family)